MPSDLTKARKHVTQRHLVTLEELSQCFITVLHHSEYETEGLNLNRCSIRYSWYSQSWVSHTKCHKLHVACSAFTIYTARLLKRTTADIDDAFLTDRERKCRWLDPYNVNPSPLPQLMRYSKPLFPFCFTHRRRLNDHASIRSCGAAFGERARVDYEDRFNNLT